MCNFWHTNPETYHYVSTAVKQSQTEAPGGDTLIYPLYAVRPRMGPGTRRHWGDILCEVGPVHNCDNLAPLCHHESDLGGTSSDPGQ